MTDMTMVTQFKAARLVSVPLVAIRTADQAATIAALRPEVGSFPLVQWDAAQGVRALNDEATVELKKRFKSDELSTLSFGEAMGMMAQMPRGTVGVALNAHRQLQSSELGATAGNVQAVANLRDVLKRDHRMLVLLAPGFTLPSELEQDVVMLKHELPDHTKLTEIVGGLVTSVDDKSFKKPSAAELKHAVHAVGGLSAFAAEQVTAMSLTPKGLDLDGLWERKRVAVEQTRGLKVHRGGERFADIVGMDNVKAQLELRKRGRVPVGVVLVLDEVDKVMANVESDTTGVRMDQVRTMLTEMEDNEWEGMLLAGIPGSGKSLIAKAFGNELGVPTVMLDLGGMEGSLVGESEERIRHAMDVVKAIGGGHAYIIATSNNATVMRPELQRRMTEGFFFVDLMSTEERRAAWNYYMSKYKLDSTQPLPEDDYWSGAEIRNCARKAWNSNVTLVEAARFIVPVAVARAKEFEEMRKYANGRYLDAHVVGETFKHDLKMNEAVRSISLGDASIVSALSVMKES